MKKLLFIATLSGMLIGCNQSEIDEKNARLERAARENDSLKTLAVEREESVNEFISFFDRVERNLDSITASQRIIADNSPRNVELKKSQKEKINDQITAINIMMKGNYTMLEDLRKKLKKYTYRNAQMEETIVMLNGQLNQKEVELAELNERLIASNDQIELLLVTVDTLRTENAAKTKDIAEKTAELHTAYYVIGKSKELEESKIVDKKGGLLGIGRTAKLNADVEKGQFKKIDYLDMKRIPIWGYGVKLITDHPSDSYVLEKDYNDKPLFRELVIKDPEKFWSASKYLVIVKN